MRWILTLSSDLYAPSVHVSTRVLSTTSKEFEWPRVRDSRAELSKSELTVMGTNDRWELMQRREMGTMTCSWANLWFGFLCWLGPLFGQAWRRNGPWDGNSFWTLSLSDFCIRVLESAFKPKMLFSLNRHIISLSASPQFSLPLYF